MTMMNKPAEGSAAEEAMETPAFEKKEDAQVIGGKKPMKKVSAKGAQMLAEMIKGKE